MDNFGDVSRGENWNLNHRRTGAYPDQASQKPISRIRMSVVKANHGIMTTSTLNLRAAGMSLSTLGSRSKKRWRLRKINAPPNKLTMKKNVAAIRRATRAEGLTSAIILYIELGYLVESHSGLHEPRGTSTVR
jgi:hypothetical protein